jgi:hypothetical protein
VEWKTPVAAQIEALEALLEPLRIMVQSKSFDDAEITPEGKIHLPDDKFSFSHLIPT